MKVVEMAVLFTNGDAMVSIPGIEYGLLFAMGHGSHLMEWRLGVMGLSGGMGVLWLEVDGPPWFSILFSTYNHAMTPSYWFADGDRFKYTQSHISVKPCLDIFLPMEWD